MWNKLLIRLIDTRGKSIQYFRIVKIIFKFIGFKFYKYHKTINIYLNIKEFYNKV